jgi:predicted ATPase
MLTKIRVKNFKSLKDVALDLGPRNVLVGANMAGKSNVIDLFKFMYDMTFPQAGSWALPNAVFVRGGFGELTWKGGSQQVIKIALSGTDPYDSISCKWNYEISLQGDAGGNPRVAQERLQIQRQNAPGSDDLIETSGSERYFCNIQRQRLSPVSDQTRSMLEFEIPGWPGNFLRSAIAKWRFYELVPSLMRNSNQTAAVKFLQEHGENLSQWLLNLQAEHYDDSFARIQQVLRDALPQVTGLFNSPTQQSTVALGSREKHLTRPVTLSQMSAGELAFIAFLSLIYAPPDRAGSLYCIEDLENYLHPTLIETLLEVLRQSQEEWERKHEAPQIVMTTHSPLVVDKMKLDEIIFVEKREGATVCSRPSDKSHLRKLLQDEEIGLGDLVYSGALSDVSK